MKGETYQAIIKLIFKLIAKFRKIKSFKNLATVSYYLSESILTENQGAWSPHLQSLIKNVIEEMLKQK